MTQVKEDHSLLWYDLCWNFTLSEKLSLTSSTAAAPAFFYLPNVFFFSFFYFLFLGLHSWHMEVPRRGVKLELQLPAYTTTTATQDLSQVRDLYHSSRQRQILNPLSEARDQTCIRLDTTWVCNPLSHNRKSLVLDTQIPLEGS